MAVKSSDACKGCDCLSDLEDMEKAKNAGYWKRMTKKIANNDEGRLTIHILRNWDREKIDRFAKHLLGDKCQVCRER